MYKNQKGGETMSKKTIETKDNFAIYQQNADKYFNQVERSVPDYFHALTDLQEEFIHAWRNVFRVNLSLLREFTTKSGFATTMPEASQKIIRDMTDDYLKTRSASEQVGIATIETTEKNIKTFNDNTNAFADLNREIMQSWIALCTPTKREIKQDVVAQ